MIATFCGHSKTSNQDKIASWLDMILPALIEGGATILERVKICHRQILQRTSISAIFCGCRVSGEQNGD